MRPSCCCAFNSSRAGCFGAIWSVLLAISAGQNTRNQGQILFNWEQCLFFFDHTGGRLKQNNGYVLCFGRPGEK